VAPSQLGGHTSNNQAMQILKVWFSVATILHGAVALKHAVFQRSDASATPIAKVISLLEQLSKQVAEEGAKEAAEYDKFACFCKDHADAKTYAIKESEDKIESLKAEIESLDAEITELNADIIKLGEEIVEITAEIGNDTETRNGEHGEYLVSEDDMKTAIAQIEGALESLKGSKASMTGHVKLNLAQVSSVAQRMLLLLSRMPSAPATNKQVDSLAAFVQHVQQPGKPAAYEYQSNEIIETLQGLLVQFKANLKELDEAEHQTQSQFALKMQGLANSKKFKGQEKAEKSSLSATKSEQMAAAELSKAEEESDKAADLSFLEVLQEQCEERAEEWDGRSKSRASEINALSEAVNILKQGVAPNWSANKKLAGVAVAQHVAKQGASHSQARPSFLQLQKAVDSGSAAAVVGRALKLLEEKATSLRSPSLSALTVKASVSTDHFEKVRQLINDLISRLEADAVAEQTQKDYCDTQMGEETSNRDEAALLMEEQKTVMEKQDALKKSLTAEIQELSEEVAELRKALAEMTELRANEHADNMATIAKATEGKTSVDNAIEVLKEYYNTEFLQKSSDTQPNADRHGKTVGDYAPEMSYEGAYRGSQEESTNILAILQVISDDFDRTVTTITQADSMSDSEFKAYESATNKDISSKEGDISEKGQAVLQADADYTGAKDAFNNAETQHSAAGRALASLKAMCVDGEETWEERAKARKEEIEALKQALKILQEWKS